MDTNVVAALGPYDQSDANRLAIPLLSIVRDERGKIAAPRDEVGLLVDGLDTRLVFRPLRQLFTGDAKAPDLSHGPTPELEAFFMLLEHAVVRFCDADERDATDQEMEQIFAELRRRPDTAGGPLRSYLRATAQLYVSLRDVSAAQYEAVMARLAKSARTFSEVPISRNYLATLRETFQ